VSQIIDIRIEVREDVSPAVIEKAERSGREAAVLALQQAGEITIREAAMELGLDYTGYLDLLAARGLPVSNAKDDPEVLALIRTELSKRDA
jgi:hypothetical protein